MRSPGDSSTVEGAGPGWGGTRWACKDPGACVETALSGGEGGSSPAATASVVCAGRGDEVGGLLLLLMLLNLSISFAVVGEKQNGSEDNGDGITVSVSHFSLSVSALRSITLTGDRSMAMGVGKKTPDRLFSGLRFVNKRGWACRDAVLACLGFGA